MQVHSFPKGTGMLLNHASAVPDASMSLRVLLEDWYKQKLFTVCVGSYGLTSAYTKVPPRDTLQVTRPGQEQL